MAIISTQRNAIEGLETRHKALGERSEERTDVPDSLGNAGPLDLEGISLGVNSQRPHVLVCGEREVSRQGSSQTIDTGDCDYAVLRREPTDEERQRVSKELGGTSLETVELLEEVDLPGQTVLIRTGIVETYPII